MKKKQSKTVHKCRYCKTARGKIKFYIIADDMENPKPYHKKCMDKMIMDVILEMGMRDKGYK